MGKLEGDLEPADHRKTLNNTALTVANFRMKDPEISPSCALSTTFETDSGHAGIMFDITALSDTSIYACSTTTIIPVLPHQSNILFFIIPAILSPQERA